MSYSTYNPAHESLNLHTMFYGYLCCERGGLSSLLLAIKEVFAALASRPSDGRTTRDLLFVVGWALNGIPHSYFSRASVQTFRRALDRLEHNCFPCWSTTPIPIAPSFEASLRAWTTHNNAAIAGAAHNTLDTWFALIKEALGPLVLLSLWQPLADNDGDDAVLRNVAKFFYS